MAKEEAKKPVAKEDQKRTYVVISGSYTTRVEKEVDGKKTVVREKLRVGEEVQLTDKQAKNLVNIVRLKDAPPVTPVEAPASVLPKATPEVVEGGGSKKDVSVTPQENAEVTGTGKQDVPETTLGKKLDDQDKLPVEPKETVPGVKTPTPAPTDGKKAS